MPTPRYHGGAASIQIPFNQPGFQGLNSVLAGGLLGPEWATRLQNSVVDRNGRVAARKGWDSLTTSAHGNEFVQGIEYQHSNGTRQLFLTTATECLISTDSGQTFSDVTNTASFTDGDWEIVNFNNNLIGFQQGEEHLVYNGTNCSQVSGSPTGDTGTAAFGRIWAADSTNTTLHYSALLDHTDFSGGDTGSFDLTNVFPSTDTIRAVRQHNNYLVVFGSRNIIVFEDGTGSDLGIDPTQMTVSDSIAGVGCLSTKSIQYVDGDMWFISNSFELMSFQRVLLGQKSGTLAKLSKHISDRVRDRLNDGSFILGRLRSLYSPVDRFYLLSLPKETTSGAGDESGNVFCFDTRVPLQDGSARCLGIWSQLVPTVFIYQEDNQRWLAALKEVTGELGQYTGHLDNGESYRFSYESGWLDLTEQSGYLLILKRINSLFRGDLQTDVSIKWAFDFNTIFTAKAVTLLSSSSSAEWGVGEWGTAEWAGGISLKEKKTPGRGTGEFIKIGIDATINGGQFVIQSIDLLCKVGRIK